MLLGDVTVTEKQTQEDTKTVLTEYSTLPEPPVVVHVKSGSTASA
jgi:hypothetical protein